MISLPSPLRAAAFFPRLELHLRTRERRVLVVEDAAPSAVLIALFERDDDIFMWLAKRPDTMRKHAGQVAFPGGKRDAADASLWATALREADEELGIRAAHVSPLGILDDLVTGTGFVITPCVVSIDATFEPMPNPTEVVHAFPAPLRVFTEKARGVYPKIGHTVAGELVWGATFAMARGLAEASGRALGTPGCDDGRRQRRFMSVLTGAGTGVGAGAGASAVAVTFGAGGRYTGGGGRYAGTAALALAVALAVAVAEGAAPASSAIALPEGAALAVLAAVLVALAVAVIAAVAVGIGVVSVSTGTGTTGCGLGPMYGSKRPIFHAAAPPPPRVSSITANRSGARDFRFGVKLGAWSLARTTGCACTGVGFAMVEDAPVNALE
jgi:8-oxo-dGTP pyrophosphatase MutT (NUDIX family)